MKFARGDLRNQGVEATVKDATHGIASLQDASGCWGKSNAVK